MLFKPLNLNFWLFSGAPPAALWRTTFLFVAVDSFFTGLVGAYAYLQGEVLAVLLFILGQQLMTTVGQAAANRWGSLKGIPPARVMRKGVLWLAATLAIGGSHLLSGALLLVFLSLSGGFARGLTYGSRLWMEYNLKDPKMRQSYLSSVEATSVLWRLLAPAWALLVLEVFPGSVESVFLSAGLLFVLLCLALPIAQFATPAQSLASPWAMMANRGFWSKSGFYVLDGAGHAMRMTLFVSGAMAVVGSVKSYAQMEMLASTAAIILLVIQAARPTQGPSLPRLKLYLSLLALTWLSLVLALWVPLALPFFVVGYAVAIPLVNVQKSAVTLGGFHKMPGSVETGILARSIVQVTARGAVILTFALLSLVARLDQTTLLVAMCLTAALLLPLEYYTAKRLHRA